MVLGEFELQYPLRVPSHVRCRSCPQSTLNGETAEGQ